MGRSSSSFEPNQPKCWPHSPIVLDLNGDGFRLTDAAGGVAFDLAGTGRPQRLGWTALGSDDAWLALDRNENGQIDDGGELFGNYTMQPTSSEPNGFIALAVFDEPGEGGNGDSRIDVNDSVFEWLRLWQDKNHDGISQPPELLRLSKARVKALALNYSVSDLVDEHGNAFRYVASVDADPGAPVGALAYDVFLVMHGSVVGPVGGSPRVSVADPPCYDCWVCSQTCESVSRVDGFPCSPPDITTGTYSDSDPGVAKAAAENACRMAAELSVDQRGEYACKARTEVRNGREILLGVSTCEYYYPTPTPRATPTPAPEPDPDPCLCCV